MYRRLKERKGAETRRRSAAAEEIAADLARYARAHGGRYLVFGSAARGGMRADSDMDLLLDLPPNDEAAAWRHAEETCARFGIAADIKPLNWCDADFAAKIIPAARVLA
jgi:predicted nucleotidyltransferase